MPDAQGILNACFDPVNNAIRVTGGPADGIYIPASAFTPVTGTPAPVAVPTSGETARIALDGAATETIASSFRVPAWWGSFTPDVYFVNETAGTGNIRWTVSVKSLAAFIDLVTEAAVQSASLTIASGNQNAIAVATPITSVAVTPFTFGGIYTVVVSRLGGDAADTHAGDIGVAGVNIRRVS